MMHGPINLSFTRKVRNYISGYGMEFLGFSTTLSVFQAMNIDCVLNVDFEIMLKGVFVTKSWFHPGVILEELRKKCQGSQFPGQILNGTITEFNLHQLSPRNENCQNLMPRNSFLTTFKEFVFDTGKA
jgi:hypothetical protein